MDRNQQIIKVSIQGIVVNLILVAFKGVVGFLADSLSIILDAVNNLSDALSSIITIIGTKLSAKRPDKKHPFGYGRIEYFSSVIIAVIVLLAGLTSFKESFEKLIHPSLADYSVASLLIIIVAVLVKYFFGRYVRNQGEKYNSGSLIASGTDAISDAFLSLSTFVGALISYFAHVSLEGPLGLIISIMIIKTAIEILKDTIDEMIGVRTDSELTREIKKTINSYPEVQGVYDLTLHSYGPNKTIGTAHIQLDDQLNARKIHLLTRRIEVDLYERYNIVMTLGIYASNDTKEYRGIRKGINEILSQYNNILQMHGFYVDEENKLITFDLIFSFDEKEPERCVEEIREKLENKYPQYHFGIILDTDISD
ncbi:MAG: cation transporter [Erysipelotrichaceae bacterium]|nr:cation transporter [Erysipelotrichaceae bacterium]